VVGHGVYLPEGTKSGCESFISVTGPYFAAISPVFEAHRR
jgi:hypothetical protein